jgi:hypothetical protein
MKLFPSSLATAFGLVAFTTSLAAAWVPSGRTSFTALPNLAGQNARTLELKAQLAYEEVDRQPNGRITGRRWSALSGQPVVFRMHPSTGVEIAPRNGAAITDRDGWARTRWEVPRNNRFRSFSYYAKFDGSIVRGVRLNNATRSARIYVQ